jgi:hypothetical protein
MGASGSGTSVTRDRLVKTRSSEHSGRLQVQVHPNVVLEDGNADKDAEELRQARTFVSSELFNKGKLPARLPLICLPVQFLCKQLSPSTEYVRTKYSRIRPGEDEIASESPRGPRVNYG